MAMIPDTFAPSVTTAPIGVSPMTAQPVQPMQNRAPEQQIQSGQVVQKVGEEVQNIGERIQYQLDDAMTKQAETTFFQQAQKIAYGDGKDDPGYLHRIGQDAITALPDAQKALADAKQAGLDTLANPFQKSMYSRVANQHLSSFGTQFSDHHFQQQTQYSIENSLARAGTYGTQAAYSHASYGQVDAAGAPTGDFATYLRVAEQETLNATHAKFGTPLGTPENPGSEVAVDALRKLHTQVAIETLNTMMDLPADQRPSYAKVQQVYDDMRARQWLTPEATKALGTQVKSFADGETKRVVTEATLTAAQRAKDGQPTSSAGTPDYNPVLVKGSTVTSSGYDPERGNVIISVPTGSQIQAPGAGKVTQAGVDADGNYTLKIEHPNKSVTAITGIQSSNVKVGDQVLEGDNVATSGVPIDTGKPGVQWSLTDPKGKPTDPTAASLAPINVDKITDEGVLQNALDAMRKQITDPELQQQTEREMVSKVRENQSMQLAAKNQLWQSALESFYSGGMKTSSVPPTQFGQLTAEQRQNLKDLETNEIFKRYDQQQKFKELNGETDVVGEFLTHPETLTVSNVKAKRTEMSNSTYLSMLRQATELENNPRGVIEASAIALRVEHAAEHNGIPTQGTLTDEQRMTMVDLRMRVADDIDMIKAQNHGKATDQQVNAAIAEEIRLKTLKVPRTQFNPMRIFGEAYDQNFRNFEVPLGAKQIVRFTDGKNYYVDAAGKQLEEVPDE
jgi:murein DD-endopeptidase MepM/ murein hydrolase activator NlpD